MQRDFRPDAVGGLAGDHLGRRQRLALPASAPDGLGHLQRLDERHGEAQHQEGREHGPADHLGCEHVAAGRDHAAIDQRARRQRDQAAEADLPCRAERRPAPQEEQHHRQRQRQRPGRSRPPQREALDRTGPRELGLAVGVPQAPVAAGLAFQVVGLPRLVDGLDDEVVDVLRLQPRHHVAHVLGLLGRRRILHHARAGAAARRTVRRPADLGDDDVLVAEVLGLLELGDAALEVFKRRLARLLVPVRQDVDGEIVDLARELGILQPDVPGLGGADRHLDVALDVPDLADELGRAGGVGIAQVLLAVPAQDVLVADQHALDVGILVGHADQRPGLLGVDLARLAAELLLGLAGAVDPGAGHQLDAVARGELRHDVAAVGGAIGADVVDLAAEHGEVALDLLLARLDRLGRGVADRGAQEAEDAARLGLDRVLVLGPRRVGDAVQRTFDVSRVDLAVEQAPSHDGGRCCYQKNQSQTDHEEAIAPARRRWHMLASGSRSHVACGRFASTQGPCRIDSTDESMTTQWADLLEASLRPVSSACDPSQTMRRHRDL